MKLEENKVRLISFIWVIFCSGMLAVMFGKIVTGLYIIFFSGFSLFNIGLKYSSQNTIKHAQNGKYKKQIDAIIDKSSKVRR